MKKALGILLALTLAVGAFAGLSLLSVSAATSQTTIVDGEYLYDDFEEESNAYFVPQSSGTVELVSKADGAPVRSGDSSLKFSGGEGSWTSPALTMEATQAVVDGAGTYMLSTWVYFETMPEGHTEETPKTMQSTFLGSANLQGSNAYWNFASSTIKQGEWFYINTFCELTETQAADEKLQLMFDGVGKGSVFYLDDFSFVKIPGDFIGVYSTTKDPFLNGSGVLTGEKLPAVEGKVSFTLYNLNDQPVTPNIQVRANDGKWTTKLTYKETTIPAGGCATIAVDVSSIEYSATDFWLIYMLDANGKELTGENYLFGYGVKGQAGVSQFNNLQNITKKVVAILDGTVSVTNETTDKGLAFHKFAEKKVFGIEDTFTAVPADGCTFDGWYAGDTPVSSDATITFDNTCIVNAIADKNLTAKFSGTVSDTVLLGDGTLEESDKGWMPFSTHGGTLTRVDGGANGTNKAMLFSAANANDKWAALGFDVAPAIIDDAEKGYVGDGAGTYKLSFYAKLDADAPADTAKIKIFLNSHAHKSAADMVKEFGGEEKDYVATYIACTDLLEITKEWKQFNIDVKVSEQYLAQLTRLYEEKNNKDAYTLVIRFDGSEGIYKDGINENAYLVDELTLVKEGQGEEPVTPPEEKTPVGVKWTFTKDFSGEPYFCSTAAAGFISEADVKNGKVTKNIVVSNTGSEDIQIWFSATVLHKGNSGDSWKPVKNTDKLIVPAGESLLIAYECDATFTLNADGVEATYTYDQYFPRFDIRTKDGGKEIKAGTEFIISGIGVEYLQKLDSNAKSSMTVTAVYELPESANKPGGDVLPVALIATAAVAVIGLVIAAKKKKEQE